MGYPAIVLDEHGDDVEGYLFESTNIASHWQVLDEFEGSAYKRVVGMIRSIGESLEDACIYVLDK